MNTMKISWKIPVALVAIIVIGVFLLLRVGYCPEYIDRMPGMRVGFPVDQVNFGERLYNYGLCPSTEVVW